jgi:ABC-type transporter Mla subunit MlaD
MPGLFFESGIDDGFEQDLNRLTKKLDAFAANAARQSKNIEEAGKNGFGWTVGAKKRFDELGNGIDDSMARSTHSVNQFAQNGTKQMGGLSSAISNVGGLMAGYFGAQTLVTFGKEAISTIAKFEKYGIVLENTLGDSQ